MEPEHKLVALLIIISLVVLAFGFLSLQAFAKLSIDYLTSVDVIIIIFAILIILSLITVFWLYRRAVIRHSEPEKKMVIRKRLEFK
jgi:uncharacterized membrane protein YqjE